MLQNNEKIIKHKVGLLNLVEELGNVSTVCRIVACRGISYYGSRNAVEDGGVEALFFSTIRLSE